MNKIPLTPHQKIEAEFEVIRSERYNEDFTFLKGLREAGVITVYEYREGIKSLFKKYGVEFSWVK